MESAMVVQISRPCSGVMQTVMKGNYPGKSSVYFLPMIDMDPTEYISYIYSVLHFVVKLCKKTWESAYIYI